MSQDQETNLFSDHLQDSQNRLNEVEVELAEARRHIRGLERKRDHLREEVRVFRRKAPKSGSDGVVALFHQSADSAIGDLGTISRTRAVFRVLESQDDEMHRDEILAIIQANGRPSDSLDQISSAIGYLVRNGDVESTRHGFWVTASTEP